MTKHRKFLILTKIKILIEILKLSQDCFDVILFEFLVDQIRKVKL